MLKQFTIMIDVVMDTANTGITAQEDPNQSDIPVDVLCFKGELVKAIRHSQSSSIVNGLRVVENGLLTIEKDTIVGHRGPFVYGHTNKGGTSFYLKS